VRTRDTRTIFSTHDEFFYRIPDSPRAETLIPVPVDYVLEGHNHGGFDVSLTPDSSPGSLSWFFFVGPPQIREKIPWADITKVKGYGKPLPAPAVYPVPGRMPKGSGSLP
jgi:hypothetical protein